MSEVYIKMIIFSLKTYKALHFPKLIQIVFIYNNNTPIRDGMSDSFQRIGSFEQFQRTGSQN